jgi:hypothetical protein
MAEKEPIIKNGYVLDENKKPVPGKLKYSAPENDKLNSYGGPISFGVAQYMIKRYREDEGTSNPFGFTFGKEGLLSILAQDGCEGIRFYLGKRDFSSDFGEGITLLGIGVKKGESKDAYLGNEPEIGVEKNYLIDDLDSPTSSTKGDDLQSGLIVETVPPFPNR